MFYANAGVCPVIGRNFKAVFYDIFHEGIANFFITSGRLLVQPMNLITKDGYGEVFASNVLGHYIMVSFLFFSFLSFFLLLSLKKKINQ